MRKTRYYYDRRSIAANGVKSICLVSSLRVVETPGHWHIDLWNRGGKSGNLVVGVADGPIFLDMLLPPAIRVELDEAGEPISESTAG